MQARFIWDSDPETNLSVGNCVGSDYFDTFIFTTSVRCLYFVVTSPQIDAYMSTSAKKILNLHRVPAFEGFQ